MPAWLRGALCGAGVVAGLFAFPQAAALAAPVERLALSEIQREEVPVPDAAESPEPETPAPADTVPFPDPIQRFPLRSPSGTPAIEVAPDTNGEGPGEAGTEVEPTPEILYDLSLLPEPVRRMRALIMEACKAGDLEALRPLIGIDPNGTQLSFGGVDGDPIEFLRNISGDDQGHEILAILYEVLGSGYVHLDAGEPNEIFIWPYFFAVPLETLTPPQRVELFTIVTAGDYEEMKTYGTYNFYRVGISPEGEWLFFVAGD